MFSRVKEATAVIAGATAVIAGAAAKVLGLGQPESNTLKFEDARARMMQQAIASTRASEPVQQAMSKVLPTLTPGDLAFPEMKHFFTGKNLKDKIPQGLLCVYGKSAVLLAAVGPIERLWILSKGDKREFGKGLQGTFVQPSTKVVLSEEQLNTLEAAILCNTNLAELPHFDILKAIFSGNEFTLANVVRLFSKQMAEIRRAMLHMVEPHLIPHYLLLQKAFEGKPFTMADIVCFISEVDSKMLQSIAGSLPDHSTLKSPGDLLRHLLDSGNHRFVVALLGEFGIQYVNQEVGLLDHLVELGFTAHIQELRLHGSCVHNPNAHDTDVMCVLPVTPVHTIDGEGKNVVEWTLPQADPRDKTVLRQILSATAAEAKAAAAADADGDAAAEAASSGAAADASVVATADDTKAPREVDFTFVGIHGGNVVATSKGGVSISHFLAILHGLCPIPPREQFDKLLKSVLSERIEGFQFLLAMFVGKKLPRLSVSFLPKEYIHVVNMDKTDPLYNDFTNAQEKARKTAKSILQRACDGNATKDDLNVLVPLLLDNFREASSEDMVKLCKSLMHIFALMNGEVFWKNEDLVTSMHCSEEAKQALKNILDRAPKQDELGALVEFFRKEIPKIPLPNPPK